MSSSFFQRFSSRSGLLLGISAIFTISSIFFVPDDGVRLLTEDDLPYEAPLGAKHSTTMLLGIFTDKSEKESWARDRILDTYLNEEKLDSRICKLSEYIKQNLETEGTNVICRIPYVFVVGADPARPTEHNDDAPLEIDVSLIEEPLENAADVVVYLNINENENHGKDVSYFKWASTLTEKYQIDYIAKAPTSTLIDMKLMLDSLNKDLAPTPYNRRVYGGSTWGAFEKSLVYADKAFYFLSSDLAEFVGYHMKPNERKLLTLDPPDAARDIGTFIYAHPKPIRFHFLTGNQFWHSPLRSHKEWYDAWETKMGELPLHLPLIPFHGICRAMVDEGTVTLEDGEETKEPIQFRAVEFI